jgi:GT2 family glycosyltransferase
MHTISVIISNFNGAKYLPRLIETLHAQRGVELQIIVVDRHSNDDSAAILAAHPDIQVLSHPPETGLVSGYHAGTVLARYDLFFFMNEDMWLEPDCLRLVADAIDLEAGVASAMPVQWTYDMRELVNCGVWYEPAWWFPINPFPFARSRANLPDRTVRSAQSNAGACMIHGRSYDEVGGWDTTFFLDFEDTDLGLRLWQRGWHCAVVPAAKIAHAVGASNAQPLPSAGTTVSKKRYIAGGVNKLAIAFKSFPPLMIFAALLGWLDGWLRNLARLRIQRARWDIYQIAEALRRVPSWLDHRRRWRELNHLRPATAYYRNFAFTSATSSPSA